MNTIIQETDNDDCNLCVSIASSHEKNYTKSSKFYYYVNYPVDIIDTNDPDILKDYATIVLIFLKHNSWDTSNIKVLQIIVIGAGLYVSLERIQKETQSEEIPVEHIEENPEEILYKIPGS